MEQGEEWNKKSWELQHGIEYESLKIYEDVAFHITSRVVLLYGLVGALLSLLNG